MKRDLRHLLLLCCFFFLFFLSLRVALQLPAARCNGRLSRSCPAFVSPPGLRCSSSARPSLAACQCPGARVRACVCVVRGNGRGLRTSCRGKLGVSPHTGRWSQAGSCTRKDDSHDFMLALQQAKKKIACTACLAV